MWNGAWLFGAVLVGMALAYYLFAKEARDRIVSQGISLQARLRYQQASTSPWTVVENFTCGWLNLLLKYMWPGFISNIATNLTSNQLSNLFARLSRTLGTRAIFRMALSQLKLRELCLGATPPRFENATVRIHPKESIMEVEVDVDWVTTGMKLIVDSLVAVGERQWNMKLVGVEVILHGRMLFVLHLSRTVLPGISGLHFTFVRKPSLTFDISLKGVMFSEVPGLVGEMKRRLLSVIAAEAVEPARVYIDMSQPFRNLVTRKQGGQQGQLKVMLLRGTDLKPAIDKTASEGARDSEACQCFIELRVLERSYVSPVAPQGSSPEWNWTFWVPVDDLPTATGYSDLRFTAVNFMARNQPQILGEGTLRLDEHKLENLTEKEPFTTKVRLKSPKGFTGGGGVLHVSLHYDSSTAKASSKSVNSSATGGTQSVVGAAEDAAAVAVAAQARSIANGTTFGAELDRRSRLYDSTGPPAAGAALRHLQHVPENDVVGMDEEMYSQKNGSRNVVDLASLSAMAKSDAREREREISMSEVGGPAADIFNMNAVELAAAQRRVQQLERAIALETQRRHEEELRALLEGAPFILHRGSDRAQRHVWVAESGAANGAMLRWQSHKGMSWQRLRASRANVAKVQYHEAAVHLMQSVTYGHELFPETQFQRNLGKTKPIPLPKDQCFSLLLNVSAEGSGESVTVALHLEVPPAGNGRSRNEWVSAFNSLMCKKLPIYQSNDNDNENAVEEEN